MKNLIFFVTSALRLVAFKIEIFGILASKERRYRTKLPFSKKIRAWRKGYLSDSYVQYFGQGEKALDKYISDYDRWNTTARLNDKYGIVLADKIMFNYFLSPFSNLLPENYFFVRKGIIINLREQGISHERQFENMWSLLAEGNDLILKPTMGYGGLSIFRIQYYDADTVRLNNDMVTRAKLKEWIEQLDNYIISHFVRQDGYANTIFPHSTNTIRMITIYDKDTNEAWIGGAAHRFGANSTGVVDNWTSGGLSAAVDIPTGLLGRAAINPKGQSLQWRGDHPDTLARIEGVQIPNWAHVCEKMLEIARFCHFCPYVGWDLLICSDRFYIIEGNDSPDIHILQIHLPLMENPKNREFFRKNGLK